MKLNHRSQFGMTKTIVVLITAILLIIVGASYYFLMQSKPLEIETNEDMPTRQDISSDPQNTGAAEKKSDQVTQQRNGNPGYTGTILAGTSSPLLDFNKADFDTAVQSDKVVVIYFFANWCPICIKEFPVMQSAFNELATDQVVGFRVNYNDNQTDADEIALAREHGIAYQHTKVILKNGQRILKSPETWEKDRYLSEINKVIAQ